MRKLTTAILVFTGGMSSLVLSAQEAFKNIQPVNFSQVEIHDNFWKPVINKVSTVTIPVCIDQTEVKTPRIRNFEKVAANKGEKHEGIYFDDSDVFKALEAIAYSLKNIPDASLEKKADEWIDKIAAAQLPDGYLNTYFTLTGLDKRWTDMEKHEDYCAGHLIEAAAAYYNTTGKRKLLDVAIRLADHIDDTFRQKNVPWVSGHQEIELALVKLYYTTNNKEYLDLADWFLQQRGHGFGKGVIWDQWKSPEYCQDKIPVKDQKEITGHAVRAMYLYTGAADVGAAKNDNGYMDAMKSVWEDVVYRNMYITGGIGSSGSNEGFSNDYDLPNEKAYCETCASVGMVFWNQRMNLLTGDAKYIDVLERSLYNGALDGLSLSGDRFFYGNPLASAGNYSRSEWFGCACCPSNIARLVESLGNYIYAKTDNAIWINLFVGSTTQISLLKNTVKITQATKYPWDGNVLISVEPDKQTKFGLHIRVPGWVQNQPVPGNTYTFADTDSSKFTLLVNGKSETFRLADGYAVIDRSWKKGDKVELQLPMPVRRVKAIDEVSENLNCVALQRGPLVYCFEHPDNEANVRNITVPDNISFNAEFRPDLLNGVVVLNGIAPVASISQDGSSVGPENKSVTAIPYYSWANRGTGPMQVWMPRKMQKPALLNSGAPGQNNGSKTIAYSGNPIVEGWYADPEGAIFGEEYWIYPTYSAPYDKQVFLDSFSSPDLVKWTKHSRILDTSAVKWANRAMWAPAIVEKEGDYFLFFGANDIQSNDETGGIGIAVSHDPSGPFTDYLGKPLVDKFHNGAQPIDQFVFKDKDGQYYLIYGGWRHCNIVRLKNDFTGFTAFEDGSVFKEITPEGYVEGPYMFLRNGKYYFMWSEGGWTGPDYSVAYAIADSPLGPFKRVGRILQQNPDIATGAGHHSILHVENPDTWYIVYHRRPKGETDANHRVTCIDKLVFDNAGNISPVIITREGVPGNSLNIE